LFEASAELSDRREKKNSESASEVGVERSVTSRSKEERIRNKMMRSIRPREGRAKRAQCGGRGCGGREYTCAKQKVYSCFSRARGLLNSVSFFLLIIGFKG
jgi:hypothetical protein